MPAFFSLSSPNPIIARIFYSASFTVFTTVLILLLLITPGDHIYQSFRRGQLYHIIIVGACILVTLLAALFIYAGRLYNTRSALANVPREWDLTGLNGKHAQKDGGDGKGVLLPQYNTPARRIRAPLLLLRLLGRRGGGGRKQVRPGIGGIGMGRRMGRLVGAELVRCATILHEATPRDVKPECDSGRVYHYIQPSQAQDEKDEGREGEMIWGPIAHPGWSPPSLPAQPSSSPGPGKSSVPANLHFPSVISEMPGLIEAQAISITITAHANPGTGTDVDKAELLRRAASTSLRSYMYQLVELGVLDHEPGPTGTAEDETSPEGADDAEMETFVEAYERARFSLCAVPQDDFELLMGLFTRLMSRLRPLDLSASSPARFVGEGDDGDDSSVVRNGRGVNHAGDGDEDEDGDEDDASVVIHHAIDEEEGR